MASAGPGPHSARSTPPCSPSREHCANLSHPARTLAGGLAEGQVREHDGDMQFREGQRVRLPGDREYQAVAGAIPASDGSWTLFVNGPVVLTDHLYTFLATHA